MELVYQLNEKLNELNQLTKMMANYGERLAKAEYEYKLEMSKEVMKLKAEGMAVTLVNIIIHGQPNVAKLRLQRDLAEVMYDANREQINSVKLFIKVVENQIQMERYD